MTIPRATRHGQLTPWNLLAVGRPGTSVFAHRARCRDGCNMGMTVGTVLGENAADIKVQQVTNHNFVLQIRCVLLADNHGLTDF